MGMMTLQQALGFVRHASPAPTWWATAPRPWPVCTPTPARLQAGDLFVALKGERFDANAFLPQAQASGAAAALAHGGVAAAGLPGIEVPDTLAGVWRPGGRLARPVCLPLIGVTGSNGKTTVTQMIASILRAWKGEAAFATQGNFNNDIGVPLMLLRLTAAHEAAVIELGMNHPGEIATLAAMARPTVALVNNAQREHLEFMHTVRGGGGGKRLCDDRPASRRGGRFPGARHLHTAVAPVGGWAPLHAPLVKVAMCSARRLFGSKGPGACAMATPAGVARCRLHIAGRHNVVNALAAAACALAAGAPLDAVVQGLEAFVPVKGRSRAPANHPWRSRHHRGGRQLQRQPRFDARRHRRAGRSARPAVAGDGRHGRSGQPGPRVPCRSR